MIRGLETAPGTTLPITLVASSTFTTQGTGATYDVSGYASVTAVVSVSSGSLTGTQFRLWFQGSMDGGASWYGLPHTNVFKTIVAAAALNETTGGFTANMASLINEAVAITTTTVYVGTLNAPPPLIRPAWNINGTNPSQTFVIQCFLAQAQGN